MLSKRTDLAVEAKEIWQENAEKTTQLEGVEASEENVNGFTVETVRVINEKGEQSIGKPVGTYITVNLEGLIKKEEGAFNRGTEAISMQLKKILNIGKDQSVMVVGLGNSEITPDNLGPKTVKNTMVTRHLVEKAPEYFGSFRKVSAVQSGVLGTTGIESAELIKAVAEEVKPDVIIAVDALASRKMSRVCRTVQITDTGIVPGSGIGNRRATLCRQSMGVPVIAVGVPTVVDAATLAADLMEVAGMGEKSPDDFGESGREMIVTPKEIDIYIEDISKLLGYSINMALHEELTQDDVTMFLS
jgi:spore protease